MKTEKGNIILWILLFIIIILVGVFFGLFLFNDVHDNSTTDNNVTSNTVHEVSSKPKELFEDYYKEAEQLMEKMSLEEKVSQLFLVRCPTKNSLELVKEYQPGGYILFYNNIKGQTKQEVKNRIKNFQTVSKIPMLIATDEEGGTVCRISLNSNLVSSPYLSPQELYKKGGLDAIRKDAITKSDFLLHLGINLNLAPISDVSTNSNDFIYARSFGKDAKQTAEYVKTVVEAMKEVGISCTLKHFPGYGNNRDSHTEATYDNRDYAVFENTDFIPFQAGINSGAPSILVSHNVVKSMDSKHPASLSNKVHEILRKNLNFSGIIMTDDLAMDAITSFTDDNNAAILAIQAGNDILISSDFTVQREAVIKAVQSNILKEETINSCVKRVLAYKLSMKII